MPDSNVLDLSALGQRQGLRVIGQAQLDGAGRSVASAGDFNGDGIADIVIGAPGADNNGRSSSGSAYVIFGRTDGFADIDLANLGSAGFRIDGQRANDALGSSVGSAGDVNGDGLADLIIGAPQASYWGSGSAYVVFGRRSGFTNIDLANLGTRGFRIDGGSDTGYFGQSVASAGDVNGDGFADLIIGAPYASANGRFASGSAFIVFGKSGDFSAINANRLGTQGFRIDGADRLDETGAAIAAAGDVNGDGFADVIVGAWAANKANGVNGTGSAYVVFGKASGFGSVDLATPLGTQGFRIDGQSGNDFAGLSVASAGDVNGDGFADVLVAAPLADNNGRGNSGSAYVVFGAASSHSPINLAYLGNRGFRIDGPEPVSWLGDGRGVASAGDYNSDGYSDVFVGSPIASNNGRYWSGGAYVVFGGPTRLTNVDLATLGDWGFRIDGAAANDQTGGSVSSAGDVNGDGAADLLLGASAADGAGRVDSGGAYVLFGEPPTNGIQRGTTLADSLSGGTGNDQLIGLGGNDLLIGRGGNDLLDGGPGLDTALIRGARSATTLVKNADAGWTAIGPDGTDVLQGVEFVRFDDMTVPIGPARSHDVSGRGHVDLHWAADNGGGIYVWKLQGAARFAEGGGVGGRGAGWTLAGRGDLDGNGRSDLVWQAQSGSLWAQTAASAGGSIGSVRAGQTVAGIGDTDGDGRADIVLIESGSVLIQRMNGTTILSTTTVQSDPLGPEWSIAAVADFNADLQSDILWRNGATGDLHLWLMNGSRVQAGTALGRSGTAWDVVGAGDLNGDGRSDVLLRNPVTGDIWGWLTDVDGVTIASRGWIGRGGPGWLPALVADVTADDRADVVWQDGDNNILLWELDGLALTAQAGLGHAGSGWTLL